MTRQMPSLPLLLSGSLLFGLLAAVPLPGRAAPPAAPGMTVDLPTLNKALAPLSSKGGLSYSSTFTLTGQQPGMTFSFRDQRQVTARWPGYFHVDLIRDNGPGTKQQHFVLVSNGKKVWTYDVGANKYSVMSFAAFSSSDEDVFYEGLTAGMLYLGDGFDLPQGLKILTDAEGPAALATMKKHGLSLTETVQTAGGQNLAVYRMLMKQNLAIDLSVNRETKQLSTVGMHAPYQGMQITMQENLSKITALPGAPLSSFVFTPPPGAVKSAAVSIDP